MFVIGSWTISWAFISDKAKQSVYYLAQNIAQNKTQTTEVSFTSVLETEDSLRF